MLQIKKLHKQAIEAINQGKYPLVQQLCQQILNVDREHADAWFLLGISEAAKMNVRQGLQYLKNAVALKPENTEYLAHMAKLLTLLDQKIVAKKVAEDALALKPENALTLDTLGVVFNKLGERETARKAFTRAIKYQPNNAQFHYNLASAAQFVGEPDEARLHYEKAIQIKPDFYRAYWGLSELEKNEVNESRLEKLLELFENSNLNSADQLYLGHAISRIYEYQGNYDKAYEYLELGKRKRKIEVNYSHRVDQSLFDALKSDFKTGNTGSGQDSKQGENAIFVLGMPRSGTTLVERIIDNHSQVKSLGELQNFGLAVKNISGNKSNLVLDEAVIREASVKDPLEIGSYYLASLRGRIDPEKRFLDKLPHNFIYIGFILNALPAAKIVCVNRNPMDVVISNFRQLFSITSSYYNYHYDITNTAMYYTLFYDLMLYWKNVFEGRIYEVSYEKLTEEPELVVRGLLDNLGLEWEPQCLEFHKNISSVATASTMQVRQPLYRTSVGRWKNYANQLEGLKVIFDRVGIEYEL